MVATALTLHKSNITCTQSFSFHEITNKWINIPRLHAEYTRLYCGNITESFATLLSGRVFCSAGEFWYCWHQETLLAWQQCLPETAGMPCPLCNRMHKRASQVSMLMPSWPYVIWKRPHDIVTDCFTLKDMAKILGCQSLPTWFKTCPQERSAVAFVVGKMYIIWKIFSTSEKSLDVDVN